MTARHRKSENVVPSTPRSSSSRTARCIRRVLLVADDIHALALEMGGTITGEHGVGAARVPYMEREHGPALDVMRSIKTALDPKGIMNPGKLFPDETFIAQSADDATSLARIGEEERQIPTPPPDSVEGKPRHESPPFE